MICIPKCMCNNGDLFLNAEQKKSNKLAIRMVVPIICTIVIAILGYISIKLLAKHRGNKLIYSNFNQANELISQ